MQNILSPSFLLASATTMLLGLWIFQINPKNKINRYWFYFCLSVSIWSLGLGVLTSVRSEPAAKVFYLVHYTGAIFIPYCFIKFIRVYFLKIQKIDRFDGLSFGLLGLMFALLLRGELVAPLTAKWQFTHYTNPGIFYPLFMLYFSLYVTCGFFMMLKGLASTSAEDKKRKLFFIIATAFGFTGGSTAFFMVYDIQIPPYGIYLFLAFPIITTYTIVRHRFLDIEVVVKRTFVFAGLVAFVFGVFSFATFLIREVLGRFFGESNFWINFISIIIIVGGYDPIRRWLVNLTDKYFFQKKYDYQKLLKDASRGISKIENLRRLFSLVVHFITIRMRVKCAAVLTRDKELPEFHLSYQRGYSADQSQFVLREGSELIRYLNTEKEAIEIEHVKEYMEAGNHKKVKGQAPHEYDFAAIKETMAELEASCCIPSFLGPDLRNILVLGEKKSGDFYTEEDLNVLFTLAQESAIAIENARLYDEAVGKAKELEEINSQLEYAKNLLMKALKETEVANKSLQDTQAQLIHEQKMATLGRLAASVGHEVNNPLTILSMNVSRVLLKLRKNPDLKVNEIMDTFEKMEQNIGRIKAVVNTLTGLLKKSEKGKFEPLSLKLILEETLPLVQFQTYLDNLTGTEVEFEVPANLPLVRGDLERLQEVFLNLFINAYHAMEGRQHRRIRVYAHADPQNEYMVQIFFKDNGKGMTDDIRKKIFNYGYTTKAPGKGSGLGLYMCKYIIELHGGEISVESKVGEGTTFLINLPAATSDKLIEGHPERRASAG